MIWRTLSCVHKWPNRLKWGKKNPKKRTSCSEEIVTCFYFNAFLTIRVPVQLSRQFGFPWGSCLNCPCSTYFECRDLEGVHYTFYISSYFSINPGWWYWYPPGLFSSVQFSCSVMSNLYDPMNHSTPGLPVHHQLPEFTQTHVHRVGDAIQPWSSVVPFSSCPQSLPASGSFPMS